MRCVTMYCMQVQDEAAGLVVSMLDPQPGDHILDACAAPGGKALFAASLMQGKVSLYASFCGSFNYADVLTPCLQFLHSSVGHLSTTQAVPA